MTILYLLYDKKGRCVVTGWFNLYDYLKTCFLQVNISFKPDQTSFLGLAFLSFT